MVQYMSFFRCLIFVTQFLGHLGSGLPTNDSFPINCDGAHGELGSEYCLIPQLNIRDAPKPVQVTISGKVETLPAPQTVAPLPSNVPAAQAAHWPGIIQWTAIGDSYATGVGVGDNLEWARCVRYSDAYPLLMNVDKRMPGSKDGRRIWNCACSGASSQDILNTQFRDKPGSDTIYGARPEFGAPQIVTLTAGGDDIQFLNLIWYCVYELTPFPWSKSCSDQIKDSTSILRDDKWKNTFDALVKTALYKGYLSAGPGFKLFVTGYPQFFNEETTQCNNATFSYWPIPHPSYLTQDLRKQLNNLAKELNDRIKAVVAQIPGVEYVPIDDRFKGHRYCEEGVTEPDPNNPKVWFFHLYTMGNGRNEALDRLLMAKLDASGNADKFAAGLKDPAHYPPGTRPRNDSQAYDMLLSVADNQDIHIRSGVAGWVRGFHPTRAGIDAIVDEIFKKFPNWPKPDPPGNSQGGPPPPKQDVGPYVPPAKPSCYPRPNGHYYDAHDRKEHDLAKEFCEKYAEDHVKGPVNRTQEMGPYSHQGNDPEDDQSASLHRLDYISELTL